MAVHQIKNVFANKALFYKSQTITLRFYCLLIIKQNNK